MAVATLVDLDPFDLPDWLGTGDVAWVADSGVRGSWRVPGMLRGPAGEQQRCTLLGVDRAYPEASVTEDVRLRAHRAWLHGQVLVTQVQGGGTERTPEPDVMLAVPGSGFTADLALDTIARLALAVGAYPERYVVHLRLGHERP